MSVWRKVVTGTAATAAVGLNLAITGPTMAYASEQVAHVNQHVNAHTNEHVNVHTNEHVNVHTNEHVNIHTNAHVNIHTNAHVNIHTNAHVNIHTNEHVNVHTNEHINVHVSEHGAVQLDGYQQALVASLQSLQCDRIDYLYSYLAECSLTQSDLQKIQANVSLVNNLCVHTNGQSNLSPADRQEACRLLVNTLNVLHLRPCFVDKGGHPVNVLDEDRDETVYLQLKDADGHCLATIHLTHPGSPQAYVTEVSTLSKAAKAKTHLPPHTSSAAVTGTLPQTATADPLLIALGAMLVLLGGIGLISALHKVKHGAN